MLDGNFLENDVTAAFLDGGLDGGNFL